MDRHDATQRARTSVYSGVCHGTLGELVQGPFVRDGRLDIAIISLPIRRYSWAHFEMGVPGDADADLADRPKTKRAIDIYLSTHGQALPRGRWTFDSELLRGKGMASSTADIVAALRCLDAVFGASSPTEHVSRVLREIERSDSVFLESHALYLSALQEVVHYFAANPRFHVCYIDEGDPVDTDHVGNALLAHYERHLPAYLRNLESAVEAFTNGDLAGIARCATDSARLAQGVLPKRHLDLMLGRQREYGADGIVVAHTGSIVGYLYTERPSAARIGELSSFFRGLGYQCRFVETGF